MLPIFTQITFGIFDASAPVGGAVTGLEMVLEKVFFTSFKKYKDWGELSDQAGQMTVRNFIDNCRAFVDCLRSKLLYYKLELSVCMGKATFFRFSRICMPTDINKFNLTEDFLKNLCTRM